MSTILDHRSLSPSAKIERDSVLAELRDILSSAHFCNSKRYPALLRYVVEQTLAGHEDTLKERTIGVEVFDRPVTYDTYADAVVRFTAGEVRKRLAAYYHDSRRTSGLRISLPLGTYVPDFSVEAEPEIIQGPDLLDTADQSEGQDLAETDVRTSVDARTPETVSQEVRISEPTASLAASTTHRKLGNRRSIVMAVIGFTILFGALALWAYFRTNSLDQFWQPFLHDRKTVLLCAGGNTLSPGQDGRLITADKATAYPYFSLQTIDSVSRLSSFIQQNRSTAAFSFAASTPLPELDSHAIVLLNAYNNPWTMRLVEPLRFHFAPDTGSIPDQAIVDRSSAGVLWRRDLSIPDSETGDYALVVRFRDTVTDNWVLVVAGLGRNGTDAASQFVTSPHYIQLLRDRIGGDLRDRNVEVVLRVDVIDGKTGPPSIVAVHVW